MLCFFNKKEFQQLDNNWGKWESQPCCSYSSKNKNTSCGLPVSSFYAKVCKITSTCSLTISQWMLLKIYLNCQSRESGLRTDTLLVMISLAALHPLPFTHVAALVLSCCFDPGRTQRRNLLWSGKWANCPECVIFQEVEPPLSPTDSEDSLNRLMLYGKWSRSPLSNYCHLQPMLNKYVNGLSCMPYAPG